MTRSIFSRNWERMEKTDAAGEVLTKLKMELKALEKEMKKHLTGDDA